MDLGQDCLPELPVPTLEHTLERYLASVKPLAACHAHLSLKETEAYIEEFRTDPQVLVLQEALIKRQADMKARNTSWLLDWWNHYAYWDYRASICFCSNYSFGFRDHPQASVMQQPLLRAALLLKGFYKVRELIKNVASRDLNPDQGRNIPLCMSQYDNLFHVCRYPKPSSDVTLNLGWHSHVAVVRKGRFYWFDMEVGGGKTLSVSQIKRRLQKIVDCTDQEADEHDGWGALTAQDRDTWYQTREQLLSSNANNAENLKKLESASLLLCLDTNKPETDVELSRSVWHGVHAKNRYFDKSIQLLVFTNGRAGCNLEHSLTDGTSTGRLCKEAVELSEKPDLFCGDDGGGDDDYEEEDGAKVHKIQLILNPELRQAIQSAVKYHQDQVNKHDVFVLNYTAYGKGKIKKLKCSPDAFVQMSFQLAYYRMYERLVGTYETASTRKFRHGRTETIRSTSADALAWVRSMNQKELNNTERAELLRRAIGAHSKNTAMAGEGQGVDRHLLGLKLINQEMRQDTPKLFLDPMFAFSSRWQISTSQVSDPVFSAYCWPQVVPEGYGMPYMILEDRIKVTVCSLQRQSSQLGRWIEMSLLEMKSVLEAALETGLDDEQEEELERWRKNWMELQSGGDDDAFGVERVELSAGAGEGCRIS